MRGGACSILFLGEPKNLVAVVDVFVGTSNSEMKLRVVNLKEGFKSGGAQ